MRFTIKIELCFQARIYFGNVMLIDVGFHFKTVKVIYLANIFASRFAFANFRF